MLYRYHVAIFEMRTLKTELKLRPESSTTMSSLLALFSKTRALISLNFVLLFCVLRVGLPNVIFYCVGIEFLL